MIQAALINVPAAPEAAGRLFTIVELRRVGIAATMIVVCGTIIIVAITVALGHYSTLSHCGPKAILDGAVIAMLIGKAGRWRCLALLGIVYGFVLLLQVGVFYLLPVMAVAGLISAGVGWSISWIHRSAALAIAAAMYELLCGFGTPIQIYFATGGSHEPIIWGLWFAEWPLRIGGAIIGVWLMNRWLNKCLPIAHNKNSETRLQPSPLSPRQKSLTRTQSASGAAIRIVFCIIACTLPMGIESIKMLAALALLYILYALWAGVRRGILHAIAGLCWGWLTFGVMSYLWHHDLPRVLDLGRTLVLRFLPLTLASMVLASTVRPVDLFRLLRKLRLSSAILMPLSTVVRNLPRSRRIAQQSIADLKQRGGRRLFRKPVVAIRILLEPHLLLWTDQLIEKSAQHLSPDLSPTTSSK
jgi:hypothetical protein